MAKAQLRDRGKEQCWRQRVARWRRSGLSVRAFCAAEGLAEPSFYAWRRTLGQRRHERRAATGPAQTPGLERSAGRGLSQPGLVPVRLTELVRSVTPVSAAASASGGVLEIVLAGGRVLRLRPGFDAASVRQLLALLEEGTSC